jgi:AhpD family alkylhydroperoxidase
MQKRIGQVTPCTKPELAEIEARILKERGQISGLYRTLLKSPDIANGWETLFTAVRNRSTLNPALREMMILRVAVINKADYEFQAHIIPATKAGIAAEKIEAIKNPDLSPAFSELERAMIKLTDTMTKDIYVPDELFSQIKPHFNDRELLELITTISAYNMVSRLLIALQVHN